MVRSKKADLTTEEAKLATKMMNERISLGRIARHFGRNKPTILKGIGIWNTGIRKLDDGRKYQMVRGRMDILPKSGERPKGQGFEIKDLPPKA